MKKIRTVVIDDEPLARARIVNLLAGVDYIDLTGEARNGNEALTMIHDYKPDLIFLDIQMPDLNGFEVLARTSPTDLPFIIFVTAYDQYALRAFDVHAVDYLLKPYDNERFSLALEHARHQIQLKQNALLHRKMANLLAEFQGDTPGEYPHQIEIRDKGMTHHLRIDDIRAVEAHGNYLKLYLNDRSFLLRQTMQSLDEQIDRPYFLRIHRSILVNTHFVTQVRYQGNNQFLFSLAPDLQFLSSRGYRSSIEEYLRNEELRKAL